MRNLHDIDIARSSQSGMRVMIKYDFSCIGAERRHSVR